MEVVQSELVVFEHANLLFALVYCTFVLCDCIWLCI